MTNEETLSRAIQKAIDGEWKAEGLGGADTWQDLSELERQYVVKLLLGKPEQPDGYMMLIFNHDFAKALWGEGCWDCLGSPGALREHRNNLTVRHRKIWQMNLQQMVIADDPIKYLATVV